MTTNDQKDRYSQGRDEEKNNAFHVLLSCMPLSAENIATITPIDARVMLQRFIKRYWGPPKRKKG